MPNKTIRNLNSASQVNGGDFLVIAQTDGSTKKIKVSDFTSQSAVITNSEGKPVTTNKFKVAVGIDSHIKGLDGVERSASNSWSDKAWMVVSPQSGTDEESVRQTDLCYFCAETQPVTALMLNRPFVSLDEAFVWMRYNIPAGADVQIEFWGNTACLGGADSLREFGLSTTNTLVYNSLMLVPKMRWIGVYNSDTGFWDVNPYMGVRWVCDFNRGPIAFFPPDMSTQWVYYGQALMYTNHVNYKTRGGDGSGMVLNSLGTSRKYKHHYTGMTRNSNFWDYGNVSIVADDVGTNTGDLGQPLNAELMKVPDDINIHVGGAGSELRFWFRYIPKIYIVGLNFCDFAFGHALHNHRFFRISNGILHVLGEPHMNYDGAQYIIANERGPGFYTKHWSSTIFETTESGMVYIMTNLRQYTVGATRSGYNQLVAKRQEVYDKGLNLQDGGDFNDNGNWSSNMVMGASHYDYWRPAIRQHLRLARVGIGAAGANTQTYVIFDPLATGWRRHLGQLCLDNGDLKYNNGDKMLGWAKSATTLTQNGFGGGNQVKTDAFPHPNDAMRGHLFRGDEQLLAYQAPDSNTNGFFDLPAINWGETHTECGRFLPDGGPLGWLFSNSVSEGMAAETIAGLPVVPKYHSWGNTTTAYYSDKYNHYNGKLIPDNDSFIFNAAGGSNHAPACTWSIAVINDNGHFVSNTPGVRIGPQQSRALIGDNTAYYSNSGDRVYSNRGYRHFGIGRQNLYVDTAPNNHDPTDPENWKYLNAGGGTDFMQANHAGWNCRISASIWFAPESAFSIATDTGSIYLEKKYNTYNYHGLAQPYTSADLARMFPIPYTIGYDGNGASIMSTSMISGKSSDLSWYHPSQYTRFLTLPQKDGGTYNGALGGHPDGFFGAPGGDINFGVNWLPMVDDVFDAYNSAGTTATAQESWGGFSYNPQDMFKYVPGGTMISEQFFVDTPQGSSITIGGGYKEYGSSYPGVIKDRVTLAKCLGNDRLIIHPLSVAAKIDSNGNLQDASWHDASNTERDGKPRSSVGRVGSAVNGVVMYDLVLSLEAYREVKHCPANFAVRSDGDRNNPYHGTGFVRDVFGINGSHPTGGAPYWAFPSTSQ